MPFEVNHPLRPEITGDISAFVTEVGGVDPIGILEADKDAVVHVNWHIEGPLTPYCCGSWLVSIFLESMGPGPDRRLPVAPITVPLVPLPGRNSYSAQVTIPANTIQPSERAQPYKLVTAVTYRAPSGRPGPMAGFVEQPLLLFYETD